MSIFHQIHCDIPSRNRLETKLAAAQATDGNICNGLQTGRKGLWVGKLCGRALDTAGGNVVAATEVCLLVAISRDELWVHTVYMFCLNENRFQIYLNTSRD